MKCLILAAGRGSRLTNKKNESKPLIPLLGLPLIERTIVTAKKAGINEFYVVVGYKSEKVEKFLNILSKKRQVKITAIKNDEWDKENGISVLKSYKFLKNEKFIILMCDHIFDEEILKKLKNTKLKKDEVILAVDYNLKNRNINIDDVTKVYIKNSHIKNIGKKILEYNGYDTGIFLCTPAIFKALKKSINQYNDSTLSGGIRILAKKNSVIASDIENKFWLDVDDKKDFKKAEKLLLKKFQEKLTDGPVAKYLNRPISIFITKNIFLKINITPNFISLISFILSIIR